MFASGPVSATTNHSSVSIPANLDFSTIAASPSGLVLSGTATLDGDQGVSCLMATVNPTTLALSGIVEPFCDTPRLHDEPVVAVQTETERTMVETVRIARLSSDGQVELGPAVVSYTELSDTHLESVYASGSLWLYAPDTSSGARALRISETTGRVLQDTPVSPAMDRPVIAANKNGLYLAPTTNTGFLGRSTMPHENGIIYHVGIDASGVQILDPSSAAQFPGYVSWITADGTSLWADICQRPIGTGCVIERFNGADAHPVFQVSDHKLTASWVVGNATEGFYSVIAPTDVAVTGEITRIDPATGAEQTITSVPMSEFWSGNFGGWSEVVLFDHALYVLTPPATNTTGTLYRVPLPGPA
jgi:hypothetical protein